MRCGAFASATFGTFSEIGRIEEESALRISEVTREDDFGQIDYCNDPQVVGPPPKAG
jgi:hypothetical protein